MPVKLQLFIEPSYIVNYEFWPCKRGRTTPNSEQEPNVAGNLSIFVQRHLLSCLGRIIAIISVTIISVTIISVTIISVTIIRNKSVARVCSPSL